LASACMTERSTTVSPISSIGPSRRPTTSGCPKPKPEAELIDLTDSGSVRWTVSLQAPDDNQSADPVTSAGLVYTASGVRETAFDLADGSVRWKRTLGHPIDQQWIGGGVLVVGENSYEKAVVSGLDLADGKILWSWSAPSHLVGTGSMTDDGGLVL